jgi:hypothetical protein
MIVLYGLNLTVALLLLLWPLWFSRAVLRFRPLNPLTVPMLVGLPVELARLLAGPLALIDDGLQSPGFQYAVLMANLCNSSQLLSTVVFFRIAGAVRLQNYLPFRQVVLTPRYLVCISVFFLAIFVAAFCLLAGAELGVLTWLKNPRLGYQQYRVGEGHWYALALNALCVSAMAGFAARPQPRAILLKIVFFTGLAYLLGSKAVMLAVFTSGMVMLSLIGWRHVGRSFLLGVPAIFVLLVWNLYLALSDSFELESILGYFTFYKSAADFYTGILNGDIQLFHGEVFFSQLWAYVPRALVPDKPFVYGILHVNEIFFPGQAELTNTPDFGGAVFEYADFGVPGVLLLGFFNPTSVLTGALLYLLFRSPGIDLRRLTLGPFLVLLAQFGPQFGIFFQGPLYWFMFAVVAFTLRMLRPPRRSGEPLAVTS